MADVCAVAQKVAAVARLIAEESGGGEVTRSGLDGALREARWASSFLHGVAGQLEPCIPQAQARARVRERVTTAQPLSGGVAKNRKTKKIP